MRHFIFLFILCSNNPALGESDSTLTTIYGGLLSPSHHQAYILETGDNALLARVHLIRSAQSTIDIQTFIWANDGSGRFVISELILAAQRGIKVRILIDDLSLRKTSDYVAFLVSVHPNIQIKQFNPLAENIDAGMLEVLGSYTFRLGQTNHRMHNKTVIVDGKYGITGGRNYADDYFDRGVHRSFKDRDVLIVGKVVASMSRSFEAYWNFELSVNSRDMKDVKRMLASDDFEIPDDIKTYKVPATFQSLQECAENLVCMQERIFIHGFSINEVEFIADAPNKILEGEDTATTTLSLVNLIKSAERSIIFQTPYLVIDRSGNKLFKGIRKKNPDLEFIVSTNSLAAADHFYAYAFSYKNKKKYVKNFKWQIFELKPTPNDIDQMVPGIPGHVRADDHYTCIHAKTFLFDYQTVWLGSFNLDPRSASLNTEAGLIIRDAALATSLAGTIKAEAAPGNSWTIGVRRKIPILANLNGLMENVFSWIPFLNIWPFTYSTSFELKPGASEVPFYHDNFY
ncbi:MAG: phospholipase D family protein [Gammaproteobacteria bacterium]|nr:phospholipase D family protein [Gammaproteobacteria bacterium]